jgi:AbrB family looped-hinge helix DNA binding protein
METKTTIDRAGRVVLPKPLRDELQLEAGDWLSLEGNEHEIVIRPVRGTAPLQKKRGIWTFGSGETLTLEQVNRSMDQVRREREAEILGPLPRRAHKRAKS